MSRSAGCVARSMENICYRYQDVCLGWWGICLGHQDVCRRHWGVFLRCWSICPGQCEDDHPVCMALGPGVSHPPASGDCSMEVVAAEALSAARSLLGVQIRVPDPVSANLPYPTPTGPPGHRQTQPCPLPLPTPQRLALHTGKRRGFLKLSFASPDLQQKAAAMYPPKGSGGSLAKVPSIPDPNPGPGPGSTVHPSSSVSHLRVHRVGR